VEYQSTDLGLFTTGTSGSSSTTAASPSNTVSQASATASGTEPVQRSSLSSGAKAGIAIGVVIVCAGIAAVVFLSLRRRRRNRHPTVEFPAIGGKYELEEAGKGAVEVSGTELSGRSAPSELLAISEVEPSELA
jgi:hypothetical protein